MTAMVSTLALAGCTSPPPGVHRQPTPVAGTPLPTVDGTDSERRPGNWNVIHRVDVPDGRTLSQVQVDGPHELSGWRRLGEECNSYCGVSIWAVGAQFTPRPSGGEPVEVGGRPGLFLGKGESYESLPGLWWTYRPDAWASLECGDLSRDDYLTLAARVVFRPTKVLLPFRLTDVPEGYDVDYLGWDQVAAGRTFSLALRHQTGEDEFPLPPQITMARTVPTGPTGQPGEQEITINGRAAFFDAAARTLCFPVSGWRACVEGGSDSGPPEPDGDARLRTRLLAVGEVLDFASSVEDPTTWFDGNTAAAA